MLKANTGKPAVCLRNARSAIAVTQAHPSLSNRGRVCMSLFYRTQPFPLSENTETKTMTQSKKCGRTFIMPSVRIWEHILSTASYFPTVFPEAFLAEFFSRTSPPGRLRPSFLQSRKARRDTRAPLFPRTQQRRTSAAQVWPRARTCFFAFPCCS